MTSSWLYVCVMVLACEYMVRHSTVIADTDTSSCILSRAARDVLRYRYKYTSCRVIASDCARQSAALDSRNCACVSSKVSATYRTDKKKCITNINVNSGCTVYSSSSSSDPLGVLTTTSKRDSLFLSNLPSRKCSLVSSDSVFLNNGNWSKLPSSFPFRLRWKRIRWEDHPSSFTSLHGRIIKLSLSCKKQRNCVVFKVKGDLDLPCVVPTSPLTTSATSTAVETTTLAPVPPTSPATSQLTSQTTSLSSGPLSTPTSSEPSWCSTLTSSSTGTQRSSTSAVVITTSSNNKNEKKVNKDNMSSYLTGVIVGVVLVIVCLALVLVFCCRRRKRNKYKSVQARFTSNPTYQKGTERMGTRGQETHYTEISGNNAQYMALVGRKEERDSYQELMKPGRQSHSNVGDEPQYMYASTDSIADQLHLRHLVASSDSDLIPQPAEKKDCVQFYNVLESTVVTSPSKLPPQSPVYAAVSSAEPEYRAYETPETVLPSHERPGSLALKNQHKTESQSVGQNVGPPQSLKSEGYETPGVMISQACTAPLNSPLNSGYEIPVDSNIGSPMYAEPTQAFSSLCNAHSPRAPQEKSPSYELPVDSFRPEYVEVLGAPVGGDLETNYEALMNSSNSFYKPLAK